MSNDQKYGKTRKRAEKTRAQKLEPGDRKGVRKKVILENPVVTWIKKDWTIIVGLLIIFFISLFLRAYFYYPVATENGWLLSGNDPFYHKRVIDYAQQYFIHLRNDPLLDYPLIGVNPRPPAYDWSNAVVGLFLSPIVNGDITASTWYLFLFSPALWGALTIFPVYFLTKDMFGRKPALIAAFFMGIMSSHIERSPLGFSDHDAMVVFFVVTSIFFLAKALGHIKERFWVKSWRNPADITVGVKEFFKENPVPLAFSIMCGVSMGTVALTWKGFPYVFVIIMGSFLILTFINHLRKVDSLGIFICIFTAFSIALIISFPYYAFFTTGTWIQPLYMLMAIIVIGIFFIPTRDLPWIIVFPAFIVIVSIGVTVLSYIQPEAVDALFTGGGYFIKSKLYSTIAEAQAPDTSRLAISYGPVTFYLALIGLVFAVIQIPKHWKMDYFLIIVWCALAIYMAMSAVRFMFNATPVFAILSGWITWSIFEQLDPTFRTFQKVETKFVYLYIGILTLVITSISYWWVYLEHSNYIFFQNIFALAMLGIFIALFTAWVMLKYNLYVGILIYVTYIIIWIWYAFDSLITLTFKKREIFWDKYPWELFGFAILVLLIVFIPMFIFVFHRHRVSGSRLDMKHIAIALFMAFLVFTPNVMFAIDASIPYEKKSELDPAGKTFGAFGHSFPSAYWQAGMEWLDDQDNEFVVEERPAFISWWDYGFWCLYLGEHPTVADNFQAGYQLAGSFIASTNETQAIALFAVRILEGDYKEVPRYEFAPVVRNLIIEFYDDGNQTDHPIYDRIDYLYGIEEESASAQQKLIKEVDNNPQKYGKLTDIKIRNAKYAAVRQILESKGTAHVVAFLSELNKVTGKDIRYFAVDTRLFPFHAQNTGIFYAPIKLADRDITDYISYYAKVEVRDNTQADWRLYSDKPIPTDEIADEIDLNDIVETHGQQNVRIIKYYIKYTDDFYNSMFYKCYIGYTYKDIYGYEQPDLREEANVGVYGAEVPGLYGDLVNQQPMQGWNMSHFRLVYRTAYWTPHNQTELQKLSRLDRERSWEAMSELEAISRIRKLEGDGKDNDNNGEVDDRGEGGTWSPSHTGGGVFFLKYYHGAIIRGKVVADSVNKTPIQGVRVSVYDEFGIPHGSVFTDAHGNYNLTAPFGNVVILASKDGFDIGSEDELSQRLQLSEKTALNTSVFDISENQAMRRTSNYIIDSDIKVPVGSVKGRIYWELTDNEDYNVNEDEIITDAEIFLNSTVERYNLTYYANGIDEEGNYEISEVVPGEYTLTTKINGHVIEHGLPVSITSDQLTVNQDFQLKEAILVGNATFTNNTNYKPGNIVISLNDLTNKTIMNYTLPEGSKYYKYDRLLPGEYQVVVNETDLEYFETSVTLEQDDNQSVEIDLIPVISVTGTVHFNPESEIPEAGRPAPFAHIEFYNNDNKSLSAVMTADEIGAFSGITTKGNFSVYIHYSKDGSDFVHVSSITITENEPVTLNLAIEPGFWVNGRLTLLKNQSVPQARVQFIIQTGTEQPTSLYVPTNSDGQYRICLPYREYRIEVYHVSTPGNITYTYYNSSSYLEKDVQQIIQTRQNAEDGNTNQARTKADSVSREITHNIHLDQPTNLWGYVYWDRNLDGRFSLDLMNYTGNNSRAQAQPQPQPGTETRSRQGQDDSNEDEAGDIGVYYSVDQELTGPEGELVLGAKLAFTHENGTLYAYTNETGYYEVYLPPFINTISLDDPRFKPLEESNPANSTIIFIPATKTYQPVGIARNFSVVPVNNTVTGYTWYDSNGDLEFDINETIADVPIRIQPLGTAGTEDDRLIELVSDSETGAFELDLTPGEYNVEINYEPNEVVKYSYITTLFVPFKHTETALKFDFDMQKHIFINLTITAEDLVLNETTLKNVSVNFFIEPDVPLYPLPIELNGSNYVGYMTPGNYSVWVEYFEPEEGEAGGDEGILEGTKYVYFAAHEFTEINNSLDIVMRRSGQLVLTAFVDDDSTGDFSAGDERVGEVNVTLITTTGAAQNLMILNNTLNTTVMPGTSFSIHINDTRKQPAVTHGIKTVRYIHDSTFDYPVNTTILELDIALIKYYNLSGRVYYDENENDIPDGHELDSNITVHFTGPMVFTEVSNETGYYDRFVLPGEYFVTLDREGFLERPEVYSYNVSLENTTLDISQIPEKIRVHGLTFIDVNQDQIYDPSTTYKIGNESKKDTVLGGASIEFTKNVFIQPDPETGEFPTTMPVDRSINVKSDARTGAYEAYLEPGEYNVYIYRSSSNKVYASIELRIIELAAEYSYNISMYEGRLVEGNVFYRDTNLNIINDLYSEETGNALRFESLDTAGARLVQYGWISKGIFDSLYLA
ncbi:STT3 domain-containing protein, partial [[Eubacterium] cellulosolvens]